MFIRAMENNEEVLQALQEFENMTDADKVLTEDLEDLLSYIAKTGRVLFPWNSLKPVFLFKLDKVMREFFESSPSRNSATSQPTLAADFEIMRHRLLDCLDSFTSAPFTIQRLCELMVEPRKHYNNSDKFMRGVEKNVLVVSTLELGSDEIAVFGLTNNIDGSHILSSMPNGPVTNGVMTPPAAIGDNSVTDERNASHVTPEGMASSRVPDTRPTPLNAQENGFDKHDHFPSAASAASEDKRSARDRSQSEQTQEATVQREEAPARANAEVALELSGEEKAAKDTSGAEHEPPVSDSEPTSMPEETKEPTEIQKSWQASDEEPMDEN